MLRHRRGDLGAYPKRVHGAGGRCFADCAGDADLRFRQYGHSVVLCHGKRGYDPKYPADQPGRAWSFISTGLRRRLLYVSPTQINAQVPWELEDTTSVNAYARIKAADGTVTVTAPVAITIVPAAPGIFTYLNTYSATSPPQAIMLHGSDYATGVISVDGGANAGDYGTITINGRTYSYTVQSTDTLVTVRDAFVQLINAKDPEVTAIATQEYTRIILQAKVQGPDGGGISYSVSTLPAPTVTGGELVLTALTQQLCCANIAGSFVTDANPAQTGEFRNYLRYRHWSSGSHFGDIRRLPDRRQVPRQHADYPACRGRGCRGAGGVSPSAASLGGTGDVCFV